jgi:uncharacterized Ntn-hydrolase superfamily protein
MDRNEQLGFVDQLGTYWIFTGRRCATGHRVFADGRGSTFCGCDTDGPDEI